MNREIVKQNRSQKSWAVRIAALAVAVAIIQSGNAVADEAGRASKPYVIGHRGAAGLAPENTLAAFARACGLGADGLELDVQLSADGEIVVHHDFRLKPEMTRAPDGAWLAPGAARAIKELTLADLKSYDVGRLQPGSSYAARYPDQVPADGERVPTLREVIGQFKNGCSSATRLFIEIKTTPEEPDLSADPQALSEKVMQLLRAEGIAERVRVISFDWRSLARVRQIAPEIPTGCLTLVGGG